MCAVCVLVNLGGQNPGDPTELKMVMSCHVGVGNLTRFARAAISLVPCKKLYMSSWD